MVDKWVVFGREAVKYDHVGSPRERFEDYWGAEFDDESECARACQRLIQANRLRFLIVYPRRSSDRDELQGVVNAEFRV